MERNGQAAARLRSPDDKVLELWLAGVAVVETGHDAHITVVQVVRQVEPVNQLPIDEKQANLLNGDQEYVSPLGQALVW